MSDLALIIDGKFRMRSVGFDLTQTLQQIKKIMKFKSSFKNISFTMETFSKDSSNLVQTMVIKEI